MALTKSQRVRLRLYTLLREPSTYVGFSSLAIIYGVSQETWAAWIGAIAAVAAVAGMVLREKGDVEE